MDPFLYGLKVKSDESNTRNLCNSVSSLIFTFISNKVDSETLSNQRFKGLQIFMIVDLEKLWLE